MRNLTKCIGIFAVGTMMLSTFFVTSCNSEDDFDFGPDSQYSLAERKMTRSFEGNNDDGGFAHDLPMYKAGSTTATTDDGLFDVYISWTRGYTTRSGDDEAKLSASASLKSFNNKIKDIKATAKWIAKNHIEGNVSYTELVLIKNEETGYYDSVKEEQRSSKYNAFPQLEYEETTSTTNP